MSFLEKIVVSGIQQSPLGTRIQFASGAALVLAAAVLVPVSVFNDSAPQTAVGAMFLVAGLLLTLRAEVYTIARLLATRAAE